MQLNGITIHEGYNEIGSFEVDITSVEQQTNVVATAQNLPIPPRELLFQFKFDPSGKPVPPDYTIKFDLPPLNTETEIEGEVIGFGGKNKLSFTLSETPFKVGSLIITDGLETFTDNGDGTLRGSEGGYGEIDYGSGIGSVTFFTPPDVGTDIIANYLIHADVVDENLGEATGISLYNFTLAHGDVVPTTFEITVDGTTIIDNGSGGLDGTNWIGTINYTTGAITLQFVGILPPSTGNFLATYTYWSPATPEVVNEGELTTDFDFILVHHPFIAGTLVITDGTETFTDDAHNVLTGSAGGSGTIDYETGEGFISFNTAPVWALPIFADYTTANEILETHTNGEGYVQINTHIYPIVTIKAEGDTIIDYQVKGILENREDELYLAVDDGSGAGQYYTLITDIYVKDGFLKIFDGGTNYYKVNTGIDVGGDVTAVMITEKGVVYLYNGITQEWDFMTTLIFTSIEFPENLTIISDGFYALNGGTGAVTTGNLGEASTIFEDFKGVVNNPEPYYINVAVSVFEPGADRPVKMQDFANLLQGNMNLGIVEVTADPYVAPDVSPTLTEIQDVSGVTFTNPFLAFLTEKGLTTLEKARKAGPLTYVNGYPEGVNPTQLKVLQGHTDLYAINTDAEQNQVIIAANYASLFKIANTPKNVFLEDVVGDDLPLFKAAQIQEVAAQNMKLVTNLLAGTLSDLKMVNPTTPEVTGSSFREAALSDATSSCGCNDCTSQISPFAYLMDLIKYGADHLTYKIGASAPIYKPVNGIPAFVTLIEGLFYQPFGTLDVDCETLHDEYCRVRLVTEVLEQVVSATYSVEPPNLVTERNQFFTLVYQTLLLQAGTSIIEVRDVYNKQPADAKLEAVKKLAGKLRIPIFVPTTSLYTTDLLWLTIANSNPTHELTAANLESLFGFRDTKRSVLSATPTSFMEIWHAAYLRDKWKAEDYLFSDFSREGVIPGSSGTYKSNWKPIIDPDNMGWEDMTYNPYPYAKKLYDWRKNDTDFYLNYWLAHPANISQTAADLRAVLLRVTDRDITNQTIENDEIQVDLSGWQTFGVLNRVLKGTNTDVLLKKTSSTVTWPILTQPTNSPPKIKYKRIVIVETPASQITGMGPFTLTWTDSVISDQIGYAKLISTTNSTVYQTSDFSMSVSFINDTQVSVTLVTPSLPATFTNGTVSFIYEVEVPLYYNSILDPEKITTNLISLGLLYSFMDYDPLINTPSPVNYTVWNAPPSTWGGIDPTLVMSDYQRLKILYLLISKGEATDLQKSFVTDYFFLSFAEFNRMMQLMLLCENYLAATFTSKEPTQDELYELVSIFRISAKKQLQSTWVLEEIEHQESGTPINLNLTAQYFWKSLTEPESGFWDGRSQTLPILDPELLNEQDMLPVQEAKGYKAAYDARITELKIIYDYFIGSLIPNLYSTGYEDILNYINPNYPGSAILPYATLDDLVNDLKSSDPFKQKLAADTAWSAFAIHAEDFLIIGDAKTGYESGEPEKQPSVNEIIKTAKLLLSGAKRKLLYPTFGFVDGWIDQEISGVFPTVTTDPIKYYNVRKMRMAPGRSDATYRSQWQETLAAWNRQPTIQPDLVPPENIINFVSTNWVSNTWTTRQTNLVAMYGFISGAFNSGMFAGPLFTSMRNLLCSLIVRDGSFTYDFLIYFTEISSMEANGEDIRPVLNQLCITPPEYRSLYKVYKILESENATAPGSLSSLLETEYSDTIDIFIAARSRYLSYDYVIAEYDNDLILDQDYFQIFKKKPNNFPLTDLPEFNKWRSPASLRRAWINTLQTRIDQEKGIKEKWNEVLMEAEDRNMPFMRDALIRSLMFECETFDDAAERLAKTYFIETKDNCCVKHTRVSFAIETLQGLLWALETGVYDDFISNFTIAAPDFKEEWKWIGSYSTWRSAIFVFLYPENLLYPTLKGNQTDAFRELAQKVQTSNRFSPEDACKAGTEFEKYLSDIQSLQIICTANAYKGRYSSNTCCNPTVNAKTPTTYFFAKGNSGKTYWCSKYLNDTSKEALSLWEYLPGIPINAQLIGSYVLIADPKLGSWMGIGLFLFFTYMDGKDLKMAYIKKNIVTNSSWSQVIDTQDIPVYEDVATLSVTAGERVPLSVTACQHSTYTQLPCFIISYGKSSGSAPSPRQHVLNRYFLDTDSWELTDNIKSTDWTTNVDFFAYSLSLELPLSSVRLTISSWMGIFNCVLVAFKNVIQFTFYGVNHVYQSKTYNQVIGIFESWEESNTVIILYKNSPTGPTLAEKMTILPSLVGTSYLPYATITSLSPVNSIAQITKTCPVFRESDSGSLGWIPMGIGVQFSSGPLIGAKFEVPAWPAAATIKIINKIALTPELVPFEKIQSGDCITNMNLRILNIKKILQDNLNSPEGTSVPDILRVTAIRDLLYEAYYFVPMLLALDQQNRGQFDSALSWYRSIYDYTNNNTSNRKIFYGLTLEESNANSFTFAAGWLLDPLNPHLIAQTRTNTYTKYTLMNIIQCIYAYADREFTMDTIETVPIARKLYTVALDLLKTPELEIEVNECASLSVACVDTSTDISSSRIWSNLLDEVKEKLGELGDPELIETLAHDISELLNSGDEETYAAKFAEAFEMINENTPEPPVVDTITDMLSDIKNDSDNASRYLAAINDRVSTNDQIGEMYANNVASICSIPVEEINSVENESKLQWLHDDIPNNNQNYSFRFDSEGIQNLTDDLSYDPISPTEVAYDANALNANARAITGAEPIASEDTYTPLITFKFCIPNNPIYNALVLKGNLELFKIFNCRNIAGMVRELDVFAAATDSTTGVPIIGASGNLVLPGTSNFAPTQYRFRVLLERAKQIAQQAQQFESLFLAALEKEDAENYAQLRAKQDLETARSTIKLQDLRIRQANSERGLADLQLDKVIFIQSHFDNLIAAGLNSFESQSIEQLTNSAIFQGISGVLNLAASATAMSVASGGIATAAISAMQALAAASANVSSVLSTLASINSQLASYARRTEEWQFQSDLAGQDIGIATQQIKIADDNIRIVGQEREIAVLNTNHAEDSLNFLKNKFTNAELYNWMSNILENSYSYMLNIATATARTAENQLYFERQEQAGPFILDDYWELPPTGGTSTTTDRRGLTGSARLLVDIQRLDQHAFETNKRKLQMTKVISLAQNFPSELQTFKETGVMNFQLTNKFFDYDFPGHYLRLINSVKTTVVGLLPVYDGIKATLTAEPTSYTVIGGTTFQKIPIKRLDVESVALTSPNNSAGLFEMQPMQNQEFLNPFEAMGIESRWEFKMPQFSNRCDFSNIADVLVTVEYTALDSYQYRYQVTQDLEDAISFNRGFSLRNNFPDQWYELAQAVDGIDPFEITIELKREFFPQGILNLQLDNSKEMILFFARADGFEDEIRRVVFNYADVNITSIEDTDATVDGKLELLPNGTDPLIKLKLVFDNTPENLDLFAKEQIKDILLLVGCKAELKSYPL